MSMRRWSVLMVALSLGSLGLAQAQMNGMSGAGGTESKITPAKTADNLLNLFEDECMSAAKAMPAEKYSFTASLSIPGAKFDGVRTFAEEVKHLAQANYSFVRVVSGTKPDVDIKAIGGLKDKDAIVSALASSFAALHTANASLTMQTAFDGVSFEGTTMAKTSVAAFAVAHGFEHYGQMVEYLRMNGIVPPASAK